MVLETPDPQSFLDSPELRKVVSEAGVQMRERSEVRRGLHLTLWVLSWVLFVLGAPVSEDRHGSRPLGWPRQEAVVSQI